MIPPTRLLLRYRPRGRAVRRRLVGPDGQARHVVAGIVVPIVIGYMIGGDGSFALPLTLIGGITIGGALSFLFLVDKVERIEA